jgi:signal transduction histidine kinase
MVEQSNRQIIRLIALFAFLMAFANSSVCAEQNNAESPKIVLTDAEQEWLDQGHTVRVRTGNWPPFMFALDKGNYGIAIDYLERVFHVHGIRYNYVSATEVSWTEALTHMQNHQVVDLVPTATITDERKGYLVFTDEYLSLPWVIFARDNSPFIGGIQDLYEKTMCVQKGYVLLTLLKENHPEIKLVVVEGPNKTEECMRKLSYGQVDAFIENLTVGTYLIQNHGYSNIKVAAPTPFGNNNQAMAIRDDWPELASIINKTLKTMTPAEKMGLRNKWLSVRYEHGLRYIDILKWIGLVLLFATVIISIISIWNRKLRKEIAERKKAQAELATANHELDAFVYTVSHDLRSPLSPILVYAELLQDTYKEKLDDQALDFLNGIERQGNRMMHLMDDLLTLAKVGSLEQPTEPVDVEGTVQQVRIDLGSQLAKGNSEVRIGKLPRVYVPQTMLTQIFSNLLGNAIRYAGNEGGTIEVEGERFGNKVRFFVRDHGPGIPEKEREHIFEVFYRGAAGKSVSGTGVGLATVKKITKLYGGSAWVEETPGGGATFCVELEG